jgi:hypothetical protein
MNILETWDFAPDLQIARVDKFDDDAYKNLVNETLGHNHPFLIWREHLSEQQLAKLKALQEASKNDYQLRLAVLFKDELVGAHHSFQTSATDVMMAMSTLRQEFRGRGIYTALTQKVLALTNEAGFQAVTSKHQMTNNPILIAKLKLGFKFYGTEIHAVHGSLLNMVFHHNELMAKSLRFRAGELFLFSEDEIYLSYGGPLP